MFNRRQENFGSKTEPRVLILDSITENIERKVHTRYRRVHIESNKNRFAQFFTAHKWNFVQWTRSNVAIGKRGRYIADLFVGRVD